MGTWADERGEAQESGCDTGISGWTGPTSARNAARILVTRRLRLDWLATCTQNTHTCRFQRLELGAAVQKSSADRRVAGIAPTSRGHGVVLDHIAYKFGKRMEMLSKETQRNGVACL